ncbi:pseudouridine synthase [Clostridia bacterium]|nr:pseudouridine synthase [Clostridia bacterium]
MAGVYDTAVCDTPARLDKFLSDNFGVSRAFGMSLTESGQCRVNGVVVAKKSHTLAKGDVVMLDIPPPRSLEVNAENIPLDIRYEDDDVIVVNKPRGMVVHPAAGHYGGTLVNALLYRYGAGAEPQRGEPQRGEPQHGEPQHGEPQHGEPQRGEPQHGEPQRGEPQHGGLSGINGVTRPGILHRIDMNTSGLLLVARNDKAHNCLSAQIKEHTLKRQYEAVVAGVVKDGGTVDMPLGRSNSDRKKMCVRYDNCKEAVTHYDVIERFARHTHLRLRLETGRTHQIRVHMARLGYPVAGDAVYGDGRPSWLGGQCLHARVVGFRRPADGGYVEVETELPDYFTKMLEYCGTVTRG